MKTIFLWIGSIALLAGCSPGPVNDETAAGEKPNTYGIELVNGAKWKVNNEMMVHIEAMETEVASFSAETPGAFDTLAGRLDGQIGQLTSKCTMSGKAHDELHKWLLPFIGLVDDLQAATGEAEQQKAYDAIAASLEEFRLYFE
jgi:hypothetical protein